MIGNNIRKIRESKKMSLRKLSELSGVAKTTLHEAETGKVNTSAVTLEKVAKALEVPVSVLLNEDMTNKTAIEIDAEMQKYYEKISKLPREEKEFIKKMLDKMLD
ncbi:helix-turn-helix domain-containing protein [Clostridium sporogenes]|uniref:helix-turn-helix domain-containing protein n=1 Tax=Clostridium sporogenes TaxID=1509 RepID=UPI0013D42AFB|nr:helix-turn-helix transcriptional regulator [Clostridium botulinum]MDU4598155.1 helix-turn-helix transcriptional regulator [Clostridium sporogenes]NFF77556.1 helix-turn-helix transcriptional regulator [Clostridium sporogenes]